MCRIMQCLYLLFFCVLINKSIASLNNTDQVMDGRLKIICYYKNRGELLNKYNCSKYTPAPSASPDMVSNKNCNCENCTGSFHQQYDTATSMLAVINNSSDITTCCSNCPNFTIELHKSIEVADQESCKSGNGDIPSIVLSRQIIVNRIPNQFYIPSTGCYAVKIHLAKSTRSLEPLWIPLLSSPVHSTSWNTTLYLYPDQLNRSVSISWMRLQYPHNYTAYEVQLWGHPTIRLSCRGDDVMDVEQGYVAYPISGSVIINQTNYIFSSVSPGWYCGRITPLDPRCPPGGCLVLYTQTRRLEEIFDPITTVEVVNVTEAILTPLVIAVICVVVILAILAFILLFRCYCRSKHEFGIENSPYYDKVSTNDGGLLEAVPVLLLWANDDSDGGSIQKVIPPLRRCLQQYSRAKVLDYTDIPSLPPEARQTLFQSPMEWIDQQLNNNVKILIISSKGTTHLQQRHVSKEDYLNIPRDASMGDFLFLYSLRRVKELNLASDYSRVFQAWFPSLGGPPNFISGIVQWANYNFPEDIREFTIKLHGLSKNCAENLPEPSVGQLAEITSILENINHSQNNEENN